MLVAGFSCHHGDNVAGLDLTVCIVVAKRGHEYIREKLAPHCLWKGQLRLRPELATVSFISDRPVCDALDQYNTFHMLVRIRKNIDLLVHMGSRLDRSHRTSTGSTTKAANTHAQTHASLASWKMPDRTAANDMLEQ